MMSSVIPSLNACSCTSLLRLLNGSTQIATRTGRDSVADTAPGAGGARDTATSAAGALDAAPGSRSRAPMNR